MRGLVLLAVVGLSVCTFAQQQTPAPNEAPPRSDQQDSKAAPGESSSHDTQIDLSPPKDDDKNRPKHEGDADAGDESPAVHELHPFNPHRAAKDNEVGDYYYKRKNYKAALARYQDALDFKENDAIANFRMALCYEKLDQPVEAISHFKEYLRILPQGPFSKDAKKALAKLGATEKQTSQKTNPQ
jgi:tetratricopeptide (TPR) repeat protein